MADNIDVTPGTGATVAADDIGGKLHQRIRPSQGVTSENLVTTAFGSVTGSFAALSLANISTSTSVYIWNDTDANMLFNWDNGANPDFIIPARAARNVPVLTGSSDLYIKYASAPTVGNVYCEVRK